MNDSVRLISVIVRSRTHTLTCVTLQPWCPSTSNPKENYLKLSEKEDVPWTNTHTYPGKKCLKASSSMFRDPEPRHFLVTARSCSSHLTSCLSHCVLPRLWSSPLLLLPVSNNERTEAMRLSELQSKDSPTSSRRSSLDSVKGAVWTKPKRPRRLSSLLKPRRVRCV